MKDELSLAHVRKVVDSMKKTIGSNGPYYLYVHESNRKVIEDLDLPYEVTEIGLRCEVTQVCTKDK